MGTRGTSGFLPYRALLPLSPAPSHHRIAPPRLSEDPSTSLGPLCRTVHWPVGSRQQSDLSVPEYNLTLSGNPVAFACNLGAGFDISGTVVPLDSTGIPSNSTLVVANSSAASNVTGGGITSSGNTSTDGVDGHHIDPPAPAPFNNALINATNAVCLSGAGGNMCFPNGTYDVQHGSLGFDSLQAGSLTLPPGAQLNFTLPELSRGHQFVHPPTMASYHENATAEVSSVLREQMVTLSWPQAVGYFDALVPNDPAPAVCLFEQTDFKGDVACFGPGGGNLPAPAQNNTQPIQLHGGVSVWIYADYYGDLGGASITSDISDLANEVYGPDQSTFSKRTVAMWASSSM